MVAIAKEKRVQVGEKKLTTEKSGGEGENFAIMYSGTNGGGVGGRGRGGGERR